MTTNTEQEGGDLAADWTIMDTDGLKIQGERDGGALTANVAGRVDGSNARDFQDALESAIDESVEAFTLDLGQLSYISSAGLRVILLVAKTLQRQGGSFSVRSLQDSIREVFEISGFDKIITVEGS